MTANENLLLKEIRELRKEVTELKSLVRLGSTPFFVNKKLADDYNAMQIKPGPVKVIHPEDIKKLIQPIPKATPNSFPPDKPEEDSWVVKAAERLDFDLFGRAVGLTCKTPVGDTRHIRLYLVGLSDARPDAVIGSVIGDMKNRLPTASFEVLPETHEL